MTITLSNTAARRLLLHRQALTDPPGSRLGREGLLDLITRLGFVQIDSINTVERAHHQILFSRNQTYRQKDLDHLHSKDASLFEHWTHDAAVIPTEFFPFWRRRFEKDREMMVRRWRRWQGPEFEAALDRVRDQVREQGPTRAADLESRRPDKPKGAGWWDWSPEKTALEFLWRTGELAIVRREAFRKIYDLTERVVPPSVLEAETSHAEAVDWACEQALRRLGLATTGEIAAFWDNATPAEAKDWAERNAARLTQVSYETASGDRRDGLVFADEVCTLAQAPEPPKRVRVLSPFDPVLRDRARAERLFGFRYRIEVFTPAPKREYGYYVFPLLEGDRMIGRIDMKANRAEGALDVTALWLEPGVRDGPGRMARIEAELDRVRRFCGLEILRFERNWRR